MSKNPFPEALLETVSQNVNKANQINGTAVGAGAVRMMKGGCPRVIQTSSL